MRFPEEILYTILNLLASYESDVLRPHPHSSPSRDQLGRFEAQTSHGSASLLQCALINTTWASVAVPLIWRKVALGTNLSKDIRLIEILFGCPGRFEILAPGSLLEQIYMQQRKCIAQNRAKNALISPTIRMIKDVTLLFDYESLMMQLDARGPEYIGFWSFMLHRMLAFAAHTLLSFDLSVIWAGKLGEDEWTANLTGRQKDVNVVHRALVDCGIWSRHLLSLHTLKLNFDIPNTLLSTGDVLPIVESFARTEKLKNVEVSLPWRDYPIYPLCLRSEGLLQNVLSPSSSFKFLKSLVLRNVHVAQEGVNTLEAVKFGTDMLQSLFWSSVNLSHLYIERCYGLITSASLSELRLRTLGSLKSLIIKDCMLGLSLSKDHSDANMDVFTKFRELLSSSASTLETFELSDRLNFEDGEYPTICRPPISWRNVLSPLLLGNNNSLKVLKLSNLGLDDFDVSHDSRLHSLEHLHIGPNVPGIATVLSKISAILPSATLLKKITLQAPTFIEVSEFNQLEDSLDDEIENIVEQRILKKLGLFEKDISELLHRSPFCSSLHLDFEVSPTMVRTVSRVIERHRLLSDIILEGCFSVNEMKYFEELMLAMTGVGIKCRLKAAGLTDYVGRMFEDTTTVTNLIGCWLGLRGTDMLRILDCMQDSPTVSR
ncbi:hypothetical protein BC829DRAFT_384827 [Chytridium lagenaria]|nr:hypothetical protein BC829DRAFT_384827 [Chytridium lagenaria]